MYVNIKLRNGRVLQAKVLPGDLYEAELASGKTKVYALADIKSVKNLEVHPDDKEKEEEEKVMKIHHYLLNSEIGIVRKICTNPSEAVLKNYNLSVAGKKVVEDIFAITSPWGFSLLENILIKSGRDFTISVMKVADVALMEEGMFVDFINRANFAYANDENVIFMRVDGITEWGLGFLGITATMAKKSAKRLMEVLRQVEMSKTYRGDDEMNELIIDDYDDNEDVPEGINAELLDDGHSYATKTVMMSWCDDIEDDARRIRYIRGIADGSIVEFHVRIDGPFGTLKGNLTAVSDWQLKGADIATHRCNFKDEVLYEGYIHVTVWEHEPVHMAIWDRQSEINFPHALTEKAIMSDLARHITNIKTEVNSGRIPTWLDKPTNRKDGEIPLVEQLSQTVNKTAARWQEFVFPDGTSPKIQGAQNALYMWLGGMVHRMDRFDKVFGFHKKNWIPMTNAILTSVITWENATRIGGFRFPGRNKNVCFYDKRIGLIMPGVRFVQTAELHGGWDGDDQVKAIIVKVHCSDLKVLQQHLGKTVGFTSPIPIRGEDARFMILIVRSPNGPGEWSIEEVEIDSLPIHPELRHTDYTVVDIAKMPLPSTDLIAKSKVIKIKDKTVYSGMPMTRADAVEMITAQFSNPGIEEFCNSMMVHGAINPGTYPKVILDTMEKIVDTCKQGFDRDAFDLIAVEPKNVLEQLYGRPCDRAILATRIGSAATRDKFIPVDGRYTRMQIKYAAAIELLKEELMNKSLQMRLADPLVTKVRRITFGDELGKWAKKFYCEFHPRLSYTNVLFDTKGEKNPFIKMTRLYAKKLAMEAIVAEMVEFFENLEEDDRHRHVLALWKYIVSPKAENPLRKGAKANWGLMDRIIFQPNADGAKNVMDILLEALKEVNS